MTTTPLPAQENLREELYNADTHRPGGQVITVLREDLRALLTPAPLSPDVEAAAKYVTSLIAEWGGAIAVGVPIPMLETLVRAVRAPRPDEYSEFGWLSRKAISDALDFAHSLGFGRKGRSAHEILTKFYAPMLTGEQMEAVRGLFRAASRVRDEHLKPRQERTGTVRILTPAIDAARAAFAGELGEVEG